MGIERFEISSRGGIQIFCTVWQPGDPPKAVVFLVHGLGEHSGRYEEMASFFETHQIAVFAYDLRGHGQSEGKKGHAASVEQFVEDMEIALMKCRSLFIETPIFLFGHSMGGQIVATYLDTTKSKEISGAIISSAWFRIVTPPPSWQNVLIKKLALIAPSLTLSNRLNVKNISSVKAEVELYKNDPQIHDRLSIALFNSLFANGLRLTHDAQTSSIPVLICHGDRDQITAVLGSEQYANNLGENADLKLWEGSFHEIHHDFEKDKVMQYYVDWILEKI